VSDAQDRRLREALGGLPAPPPGADVRERVRAAIAAAAAEMEVDPTAAAPAAAGRRRSRLWRALATPIRCRRLALGLAAVAAVALIAGVLLAGLPGGGGPEPVSAEEVLRQAMRALSSGRTLAAEVTLRMRTSSQWAIPIRYDIDRYGILLSADGSYRLTGRGGSRIGWLSGVGSHRPVEAVFNARTGVLSTWSPEQGLVERAGYPLGPPDRWAGLVTEYDFSAAARALEAAGTTGLSAAVYEGRPAWTITCSLSPGPTPPSPTSKGLLYRITIDRATAFPVCFEALMDGAMLAEARYSDVRVDAPLPDQAFELLGHAGAKLTRIRDGFRRVSLAQVARLPGYTALVPANVPRGYRLTQATAAARAVTANRAIKGRCVVVLQYERGFDSLTVTTRTLAHRRTASCDPLEPDQSWAGVVAWPATIRGGAFDGVDAQVVVAPVTTTPHLWAVKDGVLLTVAGAATAEELLAVAASLEPASR
jgi:hypothetical protein